MATTVTIYRLCVDGDMENEKGKYQFTKDWCYDHEFVIAPPIAYDHGCIPIGRRDQ